MSIPEGALSRSRRDVKRPDHQRSATYAAAINCTTYRKEMTSWLFS